MGRTVQLARCRDDALPQREGLQLGGRVPGSGDDPVAGPHQSERHGRTRSSRVMDWFPTLLAAAGNPDIKDQLLKGTGPGGMAHKVHLDGYNILPYLEGQEAHSPRHETSSTSTTTASSSPCGMTTGRLSSASRRAPGGFAIWQRPVYVHCARPTIFNLRMDPYERANIVSDQYYDWVVHNVYLGVQGADSGAGVYGDVQGVSAKPAPGQLHDRSGRNY